MVFDIGAGFAELGKTVSQTMSVGMLEQMKAANEESRLKLANELANERESRGRREAHGYDMEKLDKTQTFTAGENKADRENRIQTTGMSVGGQLASTRMTIDARREESAADRKLRERELDDRWIQNQQADRRHAEDREALNERERLGREARATEHGKELEARLKSHTTLQVNPDGTAVTFNPVTNKVEPVMGANGQPMKFRDPLEAKAQAEALSTSKDQLSQTIRLYRDELSTAERDLESARKGVLDPTERDKDPSVVAAQKRVNEIRETYQPKIEEYNRRTNALIQHLLKQSGIRAPNVAEGGPSLDDFNGKPKPRPTGGSVINTAPDAGAY